MNNKEMILMLIEEMSDIISKGTDNCRDGCDWVNLAYDDDDRSITAKSYYEEYEDREEKIKELLQEE